MSSTLERIVDRVREGLPALAGRRGELEAAAGARPSPPDFRAALRRATVGVVAELKPKSPSAGLVAPRIDPVSRARVCEAAGAAAIAVPTEEEHLGGAPSDLERVAGAVRVPLVRRDFILHELQVIEARASGASAVILMVRALTPGELRGLLGAARSWGLQALVEAHDRREVGAALAAGATIVAVQGRDLRDVSGAAGTTWALLGEIPAGVVAVAGSGIRDVRAVEAAAEAGADAVVVGSALSAAGDPAALLGAMAAVGRRGR